jgi:hypothetical protein
MVAVFVVKESAQQPWEHHNIQKKNVESADIPEATMRHAIRHAFPCRAITAVPAITARVLRDRATIAAVSSSERGTAIHASAKIGMSEKDARY